MNKTELIAEVANKAGLSRKDAEKALGAVVETITEAVVKGDKVQLVGFGSFETKQREARTGRNPKTKETIGMFGPDQYARMKDGVILVNAARGGIFDEKSLADFLAAGKERNYGEDAHRHLRQAVYHVQVPFHAH